MKYFPELELKNFLRQICTTTNKKQEAYFCTTVGRRTSRQTTNSELYENVLSNRQQSSRIMSDHKVDEKEGENIDE